MPEHYFRFDATTSVSSETAFTVLVGEADHGFWLDDSLGETVSYIGIGTPIPATDGFTDFDGESDSPICRVGWIPYGERTSTLGVVVGNERHPGPRILRVDCAVEFNYRTGSVMVYSLNADKGSEWVSILESIGNQGNTDSREAGETPRTAHWRDTPAEYAEHIAKCTTRIRDGDAYQLCLTTSVSVPGPIDTVATYLRLRRAAPTRYGGMIRYGGVSLLSASPESFLAVSDGMASTQPIKGTRRRSADPAEDDRLKRELLESDKERAENLMIVDLCRNDLSTVCEVGSVNVPALHVVETYSTVHQLVSTVTGELLPECSAADAARALFPAGSMTGAPKRSAVQILERLESAERGMYAGAFGYAGGGNLTLAMTIRSIVVDDSGAHIGVGGGITSGSVSDQEIIEVGVKAAAMLGVLGASPNPYLYTE
jgi:para-aminobenzoate synthetase component I